MRDRDNLPKNNLPKNNLPKDNLPKDNLPKPNLLKVKDRLPNFFPQIVPLKLPNFLGTNCQVPSVFKSQCFWPSDMPPFLFVPRGPLGPLLFPSCRARSNRTKDLAGTEIAKRLQRELVFAGQGQFAERQFAKTQFAEREGQFAEFFLANCPFEFTEFCRVNLPNT